MRVRAVARRTSQQALAHARRARGSWSRCPHVESSYNPKRLLARRRRRHLAVHALDRPPLHARRQRRRRAPRSLHGERRGRAAARAQLREITGTWPLAITAYNHGAGGMTARRAHARHHATSGEIVRALPQPQLRLRVAQLLRRRSWPRRGSTTTPTRYFGRDHARPALEHVYRDRADHWYTPSRSARARARRRSRACCASTTRRCVRRCGTAASTSRAAYALRAAQRTLPSRPERAARLGDPSGAARRAAPRPLPQGPPRRHAVADRARATACARASWSRPTTCAAATDPRGPGARAARPREARACASRDRRAEPRSPVAEPIAGAADAVPRAARRHARRSSRSATARPSAISRRPTICATGTASRSGQRLRVPGAPEPVRRREAPESPRRPRSRRAAVAAGGRHPADRTGAGARPRRRPERAEPAPAPEPPRRSDRRPRPSPSRLRQPSPRRRQPSPRRRPKPHRPARRLRRAADPAGSSRSAERADRGCRAHDAGAAAPRPLRPHRPAPRRARRRGSARGGRPRRPAARPIPRTTRCTDDRVTVQADETLGHFADWLEVRRERAAQAQPHALRAAGRDRPAARSSTSAQVSPQEFEQRRLEYHQSLQDEFFEAFVVTRHRAARARGGRIALVPRAAQVPRAGLAAAPVQPRPRLRLAHAGRAADRAGGRARASYVARRSPTWKTVSSGSRIAVRRPP